MQETFVFVVCGADEHIETLNYALDFLRHFCDNEIVVVTDRSRNTLEINHPVVVDVATPKDLNHHQASIYLKTGLHRFVDIEQGLYCYLDTDIVAVDATCAEIFKHYQAPITFSTDHCRMRKFSPSAVVCPLTAASMEQLERLNKAIEQVEGGKNVDYFQRMQQQQHLMALLAEWDSGKLQQAQDKVIATPAKFSIQRFLIKLVNRFNRRRSKSVPFRHDQFIHEVLYQVFNLAYKFGKTFLLPGLKFEKDNMVWYNLKQEVVYKPVLSFFDFFASRGFIWNASSRKWFQENGEPIFNREEDFISKVAGLTGLSWDNFAQRWYDETGLPVGLDESDTLRERIKEKFDIEISIPDWQHWNGGVFLFDKSAVPFLECWHNYTMQVFQDTKWKTRDQGTLIATAWKFGLQNHPTLPVEFNFIADYNHPLMVYKGDFTFDLSSSKQGIKPKFLHIYHHWGDTSWALWLDVDVLHNKIKQP